MYAYSESTVSGRFNAFVSNKAMYGSVLYLYKKSAAFLQNFVLSNNPQAFFVSSDVTANLMAIGINDTNGDTPFIYMDANGLW